MELGGSGRRQGEDQVETCHADGTGPDAVKGRCKAWTEGLEDRVTSPSG